MGNPTILNSGPQLLKINTKDDEIQELTFES